jgi:hypothetical protein
MVQAWIDVKHWSLTAQLFACCLTLNAGCGKDPPSAPDAHVPEPIDYRCDTPGVIAELPATAVVGMDATKLVLRGADGVLRTWAKTGGPVVELETQGLPARLVVSGSRYYWWSPGTTSLMVTDDRGIELATATLSAENSVVKAVTPAPDEGVFLHSQCQESGTPCTPTGDRIELVRNGSTVAETLATSSYPIHSIAAGSDEVIWTEIVQAVGVSVRKWQRSTGSITTLVDSLVTNTDASETLAVKGSNFYVVAEQGMLQSRSLETGALIHTYVGYGPTPQHLRVTEHLFWTERPGVLTGPFCVPKRGLVSIPLSGGPFQSIDVDAHNAPFFVDETRVYFSSGTPHCCWSSGFVMCGETSYRVRCYHR